MSSSEDPTGMGVPLSHLNQEEQTNSNATSNIDHAPLDTALLANMMMPKMTTIKIPTFLPYAVKLWTHQCQALFALHGVQSEQTKYYQVLASLDAHVIQRITAYVSSPTVGTEFSGLVDALEFAYELTDGEKFDEIMSSSLGDMKPSQLYDKLHRLWLDDNADTSRVLRHIFLSKLPLPVAVTLKSIPYDNSNNFLRAADAMTDQNRRQSHQAARSIFNENLSTTAQTRYNDKYKPRTDKNAEAGGYSIFPDGFCYYHHKFGEKARKCYSGCSYTTKSKVNCVDADNHITLPSTWNKKLAVKLDQKLNGKPIIVDTGSSFSLVPAREQDKKRKPNYNLFKAAQGASIPVYGQRTIPVHIGTGRVFHHKFFIAGVDDPLLGMDFLLDHRLLVDPIHGQLLDVDTYQSTSVYAAFIKPIQTVQSKEGKFTSLWKEFPSLSNASVDKLAQRPSHSIEHDIILKPGSIPTKAKARRLFGPKLEAAKQEIEVMLRLGILQRSSSEWASPLHVVPKSDGTFRPCGDFRHLNACTVADKYPLPHLQDFSSDLKGSTIFSKIDLVRAFHQIPLSLNAISKTAMITPFGLFEFLRMPFGLCNAAQAFQRFMDEVTRNLSGVYVYIDDILVASENEIEHEKHLRQLFARLSEYGLIVNPSKSELGMHTVNFLGFSVTPHGIHPLEKKMKAIDNFPVPQKFGQLSEFLGMVNFYHRFMPRCSEIAKPLYDLLKTTKNVKKSTKAIKISEWKNEHDNAFKSLKSSLTQASTLSYPCHDVPTRLITDASEIAAGAALEQNVQNTWKPIGFYSKAFHGSELNYSAYDRELLAIKLALQHFRHIVEGIPADLFHVATDHKPLTTAKNFDFTSENKTQLNRVSRTWQFISEFTTDIRHVSGSDNIVADALSRNPVNATSNSTLLKEIEAEQRRIGMHPQSGKDWPGHWEIQQHHGHELVVDTRGSIPRPVVPDSLTKNVFNSIHDLAHLGVKATKKAISYSYVWPNMAKDVTNWVGSCSACQAAKIHHHNKVPFQPFSKPLGKFQNIHVDIVGPLPTSKGCSYILTVVDRFSRWPAAIPLTGITAKECSDALIHGWIQFYGTPLSIVTDRGRQFTSNLWQELCASLGATHDSTTAYHPQANGMVERFHRQLKSSLMSLSQKNATWYADLPITLLGIRNAIKEDLGISCAQMIYGESIRLPNAFFPSTIPPQNLDSYIHDLRKKMANTKYILPSWHGNNQIEHRLKDLDSCSHVYVRVSGMRSSLERPYTGPYKVITRKERYFVLEIDDGSTDSVSIDRLKPAYII